MTDPLFLICHKDHKLDPTGSNGGAEIASIALARFIARMGLRVVIAAQLPEGEMKVDGVEFWDLGRDYATHKALERADAIGAFHLISAGRIQVIMESQRHANCLSRILITHDRSGNDTGMQASVASRNCDYVVCVSNAQRDVLIGGGANPKNTCVVYNGVDLDLFKPGDPSLRNWQQIVFAGAIVEDKGIHYLIQAFAKLKPLFPKLLLDVYGSASLWGRDNFFDPTKVSKNLHGLTFHGTVSPQILAKAYQTAGICAYPSIWFEPFGMCASDALATGCPVITYEVGGPAEIVMDGKNGVVVQDISVEALFKALENLLGTPQKLNAMSQYALDSTRQRFDWVKTAKSLVDLSRQAAKAHQ